jgi:outer membrane protein
MRAARTHLTGFVLLLLAMMSSGADAQTWGLRDCIHYAFDHNIDLGKLRLQALAANQDLLAANAARNPSLAGNLSNTFTNGNSTLSSTGSLVNQTTSSGTYTVNSSVVLWNGGYIRNNILLRELLQRTAALSAETYKNSISILITQYYLTALLDRENHTYVLDLVSTSGERVKQGQQLYDAGSIARKDLLQLEAQLATDQYLLVQTENQIRVDLLNLRQLLQLPSDTSFEIQIPDTLIIPENLPPLPDVQANALNTFPEILTDSLNLNIASLDIDKARAGFYPALSARGALGSGYASVIRGPSTGGKGYGTQMGDNLYASLGVALTIPMYSNRINRTNLEKAKIGLSEAQLTLQGERLRLSQTVEQAYIGALNALRSYDAARKQYESAAESYRIMNEEFKLGGVNTYDLLQQRNQYLQGVQAMNQAKYTAVLQEKLYEFYKGVPMDL